MPRAKFQIERKCKICGKPFMALTIESQYCSPACGQKAYKIRKREQKRNEELQQVIEGLASITLFHPTLPMSKVIPAVKPRR